MISGCSGPKATRCSSRLGFSATDGERHGATRVWSGRALPANPAHQAALTTPTAVLYELSWLPGRPEPRPMTATAARASTNGKRFRIFEHFARGVNQSQSGQRRPQKDTGVLGTFTLVADYSTLRGWTLVWARRRLIVRCPYPGTKSSAAGHAASGVAGTEAAEELC
jgi:hypothetical protein